MVLLNDWKDWDEWKRLLIKSDSQDTVGPLDLRYLVAKIEELEKKIHDHPFECHYNDLKCDLRNKEINSQEQKEKQ